MVMDEGLKFGDLKPTLELYLQNIERLGGADLAGTYSTRLAEVEGDIYFWEDLHTLRLPDIVEAKIEQVLKRKEEQVAKATEDMKVITTGISEARAQQAHISAELEEATRIAGTQVETMDKARSIIEKAQKTLAEVGVLHAQLTERIAEMEAQRRALTEQVELRLDDLKRVEEETRETLAVTDEEVRAAAQKEAEEQHQAALREIEEKLRSLE
jgi:chromosome segregation ATPase